MTILNEILIAIILKMFINGIGFFLPYSLSITIVSLRETFPFIRCCWSGNVCGC